ncbi:MAG: hypothetical protein QM831_09400 [Kofleriaceae bacterium]
MSCPAVEMLAAFASGEEVEGIDVHVATCAKCAVVVNEQRVVRQLAQQMAVPRLSPLHKAKLQLVYDDIDPADLALPPVKLDPDHRARLAAETMARFDTQEVVIGKPRRRRAWMYVAGGLAAAAAVAAVLFATSSAPAGEPFAMTIPVMPAQPVAPATPVIAPPVAPTVKAQMIREQVASTGPVRATTTAAATAAAVGAKVSTVAAKVTGDSDADYTRLGNGVVLRDGIILVDARDRAPVAVAVGDTKLRVHNAHVEIKAAHGVIVSAHSFAGSVERTSPESKAVIQSGEEWAPTPREAALAAFRIGWRALHEGRNADALAAFERASDPVVSEESSFWAAVAAQRAGDLGEAKQRFRAFLDAYPHSTRADAARAGLGQ